MPVPSQWPAVPQSVPRGCGVVVAVQTNPVVQLSVPTKQSFGGGGVQAAPAVQAVQVPPEQTSFVPQVVPPS